MPAGNYNKTNTPLSALPSMTQTNTTTAIQSGPYTKAQFQSTMEGSRTVKNPKEVEHILRDYPAALELYRTGKYKVKVKCEADIERVILVEKRTIKPATDDSTTTKNNNEENNQNVPESSASVGQDKEIDKDKDSQKSRSRTQSKERMGSASLVTNGMNVVHATISSISMANNNQPKVDHQRAVSNEREVDSTPSKNQSYPSDDIQKKVFLNPQQGNHVNREYPRTMVPYVPQACKPRHPWPQPQFQQPYFSNSLFQTQQRPNLSVRAPFPVQQNLQYNQSYYLPQRPTTTIAYVPQQSIYPISSTGQLLKPSLQSVNTYASASRSITNLTALPPTFRTFQSSYQHVPPPPALQVKIPSVRPLYQPQIPFPINQQLPTSANEPISALANTNIPYVQQQRGARNRALSVDASARIRLPLQIPNIPQQPNMAYVEHYHHHHHRRHHHHRPQANPTNNADPSVANPKETNVPAKERPNGTIVEKLTIRELNETFHRIDPSGRLPYNLLPGVLQRYGILSTENDLVSAAKDLEYNLTDPVSARRLIHLLIKLGKITKSNQQPRQPASPSMLPEDREVTDIMTQRNTTTNQ